MKKILITWSRWMLASDFLKYWDKNYEIFPFDKETLDITNFDNLESCFLKINPDLVINFAAYTKVDDAQDIWIKNNFDVNTIWVYNLAKVTNKLNIEFITISTDYVFDWWRTHSISQNGKEENNDFWYDENDDCNPINNYWISKYLWEKLALNENKNSIIIRTSWLFWWWFEFKNFVNTMLKLSKNNSELKIVNDQFWLPTYTVDLCESIFKIVKNIDIYKWKIFHLSNSSNKPLSWYDFAWEIFNISWININLIACDTNWFPTKAKRPKNSYMKNNSEIVLRDWKEALTDYLNRL